ncbi:neuroblast differentiation-associated protein AHNAK [Austrofundulus limnaeus]|uniref:Neuroblast differentiation-associated protein AHNAK n=1 Tax=Austrofundulus limnaeus TaxID=52670 RepID=A0A2I4BUM1_AUSLI|nr:PREDICTED: periaxin [Austrofundulus limnaeus]
MDSEPAEEQTTGEKISKPVEIMVETDAGVGASGYSVTGGGERGIFVKDVLKDSLAAKHLSLQQGDQLLSAKVYFDNVKYEDALRILQSAEPYKVSFQLKRTIPKAEASVRPRAPSVEVKTPKVKMAKMSVKGTKPFKALKKRGGRFGLKRLKEKHREEVVIEGTPPRLETGDVDVEFSLPKVKQRKSGKFDEQDIRGSVTVGKPKRKIRFPHMKVKKYTRSETEGKVETGQLEGHINVPASEIPGAKVKTKGKGHKFGITFPKTKHIKSDSSLERGSVELKPPDVSLQPPPVEFSLSESKDKDVDKRGSKFNPPDVEFALPLGKPEVSLPKAKGSAGIKAPKVEVKGEVDAPEGRINVDSDTGDTKLKMPKLKLPKVRLSRHSDEIDGEMKVKAEGKKIPHAGVKTKGDGEVRLSGTKLTTTEVKGEGCSFELPSVVSLPKVKFETDGSLQDHPGAVKTAKMPAIEISVPKVDLEFDTRQRIPDEVEGTVKGAKISMPKVDIALPKMGSPDVNIEGPDGEGKFSPPSLDISVPKVKSDVDMDYYVGGDGKFKMPEFDVTLPKLKPSEQEVEGSFKLPKVDLTLPKVDIKGPGIKEGAKFNMPAAELCLPEGKAESKEEIEGKGSKLKMASVDVSLPKFKSKQTDISIEEPEFKSSDLKAPAIDISLPQGTFEGNVAFSSEGEFKLPSIDMSHPGVKFSEGDANIQGPKVKSGKFEMPNINVSLPKGKEHRNIDINIHSGTDGNIDLPYCDIGGPEGKTGKFKLPKVDITLPKLPEGEVKVERPEVEVPTVDISLPKGKLEGDLDVDTKGAKFQMPSLNINLPKIKSKETDIDIKGNKGKFEMPSLDVSGPKIKSPEVDVKLQSTDVDISLPKPKAVVDIDYEGKDGKIKMPKVDISLPKVNVPEGNITIKKPVLNKKIELPDIDISPTKGKLDVEFDGHGSKSGKFQMPSVDFSLPKLKAKRADVNIEGPEIIEGSTNITEVSFPTGKAEVDISVESPDVKGGKLKMPKFNVSLPKVSLEGPDIKGKFESSSADISLPKAKKGVEIEAETGKGSKFHLPSVDFSLPKVKAKGLDVDIQGPSIKGDVSLPKLKAPEVDVNLKGPEIEGPKIDLPSVDVSLPKGTIEGDINNEGPEVKGGKFKMPTFDVSLPKVGLPTVEGPDIKGKFEMPSLDISLPNAKVDGDFDVEGPEVKGGKFKMPKMDVSLPKVNLPEGDLKIKGPDIKTGKIMMPDVDLSLPKGKVKGEIEAEGHAAQGGKFHMPSIDINLPKMKAKGPKVDVEGPQIEGPNVNMPSIDVSLPKGTIEGDISLEGPDVSSGKFMMPKFDVSLPKVSLPKVEGPDIKGKFAKPSADISLPKVKVDGDFDVEGLDVKGGKYKMPKVAISFPKVNLPEGDVKVEGPEIKEGTIKVPAADISFPGGKVEGDISIEVPSGMGKFEHPKADKKGGKLQMPSLDINMPRFDLDLNVPSGKKNKRFKMDASGFDVSRDLEMSGLKSDIKTAKLKVKGQDLDTGGIEDSGASLKLPSVKLPTVDISAPKVDLNFVLPKPQGDEVELELLKAEGGRPSSGSSFDIPDVSLKVPSFSLPRFGGKSKSGDLKVSGPKGDVSLNPQSVEGEIRAPSVEFDRDGKVKVKKTKMKFPSFGISKTNADVSVSCPDVDVKMKCGKPDIPKVDFNLEVQDGKGKHKTKFPKFKMSSPKVQLTEGEVDAKVEADAEGKAGFHVPDVTIKLPKFSVPGFGSKEQNLGKPNRELEVQAKGKMPSVELSLPAAKTPETEVLLPKTEVDVSEADIKGYEGNLKIPKVDLDVSLPKGKKMEGPDVELKGGEGKFKMPTIDVSLPKGKSKDLHAPSIDIESDGDKFKMPYVKMPTVDITIPKHKTGQMSFPDVEGIEGIEGKEGKFKMPTVDIFKGQTGPDVEIEGGGKLKMPNIKMPHVDFSLPKMKTPEVDAPEFQAKVEPGVAKTSVPHFEVPSVDVSLPKAKAEVKMEGGAEQKFKMPGVDIFLPKGKFQDMAATEMPHVKMPNVDISLPKGKFEGPEVEIKGEGGKFRMPHISMPSVDISLPKGKVEGPNLNIEGSSGEKFKLPQWKMPDVDVSLPKGHIEGPEMEIKGEGGKFKMPSVDISLPKGKVEGPNLNIEGSSGEKFKLPQWKMPDVDVSLPKGHIEGPEMEIKGEGGKFKMPSVDISLPKGKVEGLDVDVKIPYMKIPSAGVSIPKGEFDDLDAEMKGNVGGKFKLPHVKMPNVEFSVPKGKDSLEVDIKGQGGHFKMPHISMPSVDISLPKGNFESPEVELEGDAEGRIKMPNVDISLPKEKSGKIKGTVEGEGNLSNVSSVGISLPKVKTEGPNLEIKGEGGKFKMPKVDISLPKGKGRDNEVPAMEMELTGPDVEHLKGNILLQKEKSPGIKLPTGKAEAHKLDDMHVEGEHKGLKLKGPTTDIKGPQGDLELHAGLHRGEGKKDKTKVDLPDLDLNTAGTKVKEPKVKGKRFKIGLPKRKTGGDVTVDVKSTGERKVQHNEQSDDKNPINIPEANVTLPSVCLKTEIGGDKANSSFSKEIKIPRITDIEFDIGASQDEDDDRTETDKKVKIPKFGVPLPSLTSPEREMNIHGPEVQYEGPKIPKVKKAVFVLVKPNDTDESAVSIPKSETTAEMTTEEVRGKMPKIKIKSNFGKSKDKTVELGVEREEEEEETSKGEKFKMPKVSFSSGKSGSFDVAIKEESSSIDVEKDTIPHQSPKDDKGTFSGKIKFPKVEFTSPYGKMSSGGEKTETRGKMGKDSSPREVRGDSRQSGEMAFLSDTPETSTHVVSSHARTDMLDRDSSESPVEFSSTKTQMWREVDSRGKEAEEKESSSWFKVPKITLKPHTSGFLQITPEGSPQAQRRGEVGGEADVSGSFFLHTSGLDFTSQQTSEEVSSMEAGTHTTVIQTTRITRHLVTSETQTGVSTTTKTTTSHQVTDF